MPLVPFLDNELQVWEFLKQRLLCPLGLWRKADWSAAKGIGICSSDPAHRSLLFRFLGGSVDCTTSVDAVGTITV